MTLQSYILFPDPEIIRRGSISKTFLALGIETFQKARRMNIPISKTAPCQWNGTENL